MNDVVATAIKVKQQESANLAMRNYAFSYRVCPECGGGLKTYWVFRVKCQMCKRVYTLPSSEGDWL